MKNIKGFILLTLTLIMMLSFSTNVCAKESINNGDKLIEQGFTNDGTYYAVYETQNVITPQIVDRQQITRRVVYYSLSVTPQNSISWSEKIGGSTYTGNLYLTSWARYPSQNITQAWYKGTVAGNI